MIVQIGRVHDADSDIGNDIDSDLDGNAAIWHGSRVWLLGQIVALTWAFVFALVQTLVSILPLVLVLMLKLKPIWMSTEASILMLAVRVR